MLGESLLNKQENQQTFTIPSAHWGKLSDTRPSLPTSADIFV